MQTQHVSDVYPNVISITKVRQDIDTLLKLLDRYEEVKVLRGQKVLFSAVRPKSRTPEDKIKKAIAFFDKISKKYKTKKGEISASEWIIRERDRMTKKSYYEEHNR